MPGKGESCEQTDPDEQREEHSEPIPTGYEVLDKALANGIEAGKLLQFVGKEQIP